MRLRLTRPAARQLKSVLDYIAERHPGAARRVDERIQSVMNLLLAHPFAGQPTGLSGMRRIVVSPYPYAIFYRVGDEDVVIHGIRHTARRPA